MSQFIFRVLWLIWSKHSSPFFEFPVRKQFPFVLLQAKAVGFKYPPLENIATLLVSISSPSGEGGECRLRVRYLNLRKTLFPLVLLQAKAVRKELVKAESQEMAKSFH